MAVQAVCEQQRSESGLGAARTAHHYARLTVSAPSPATSFGIWQPTAYAPVPHAGRIRHFKQCKWNDSPDESLLNGEVYVKFSGDALLFAEAAHGLTTVAPSSRDTAVGNS
jgi:hypothetical protein